MGKKLREPTAGKQTVTNLLLTALQPVGSTMYVWGGGWNEEDNGAGVEARSIDVSLRWKIFADRQNSQYDYLDTRYQIHNGLDCSGYVGWVIYNVFEQESGNAGYVMPASYMAWEFAGMGWGRYTPAGQVTDWKAGDIMSMKGHVWIALGMCGDGSVVLLHASPPGVMLCGTTSGPGGQPEGISPPEGTGVPGEKSQALLLAEKYMSRYYPDWYARYTDCSRDASYLEKSARMRWCRSVLTDPDDLTEKSAEEVLAWLFREK